MLQIIQRAASYRSVMYALIHIKLGNMFTTSYEPEMISDRCEPSRAQLEMY